MPGCPFVSLLCANSTPHNTVAAKRKYINVNGIIDFQQYRILKIIFPKGLSPSFASNGKLF